VNYETFASLAGRMYDEIPGRFREGISGVTIERDPKEHPLLSGVWTMGECVTDQWPDPLGGHGDTRSEIVLYHGSFGELAARDARFEWEPELWETMLHELLHHREAAAAEDGLDVFDWAMDQNFRRLEGFEFNPHFHRVLPADSEGQVRLDGETFIDVDLAAGETVAEFPWRGRRWSVRVPLDCDLLWGRVRNLAGGRLWVVASRQEPWLRRILRRSGPDLWVLERRALPARPA
jgi:hypothetical protein